MRPGRAVLLGALTVGILDGLDAIIFFGIRSGTTPTRIFQSIAAGVLGRDAAVAGGVPAALLGVVLHFIIAFLIVSIYYAASTRLRILTERTVVCGVLYGIVAYIVMTFVVVPNSAIARPASLPVTPVLINGLLIHIFGVGLPSALAARLASQRVSASAPMAVPAG